ncbi:hypothetical protein P4N68_11120 [Corynebacterium felinum]|uniref:Uncharacterized protein n=1 Tax=Corynebacterium felinum TaxID=131318 RepID=A0ABU2B4H3_9CORY|nr:hypothetical protein [Corynebacterium felinum]MDF5821626.1 hypothetical protein [Corynebacterium felinum]MDR7353517.1 hypothetical protein [Corynebacterium felinum]WJY95696.1 hypothetical protein CFELI_10490 [Corynebacterium felinum]
MSVAVAMPLSTTVDPALTDKAMTRKDWPLSLWRAWGCYLHEHAHCE